jgi:hypothetical protein
MPPLGGDRAGRIAVAVLVAGLLLGACGDDDDLGSEPATTTAPAPVSSTRPPLVAPTGSLAPAPTTTAATTTSEVPVSTAAPISTTEAEVDIVLAPDGLGVVYFGAAPGTVESVLSDRLGPPGEDTGWIDSFSEFGTCPGREVRVLSWGALQVLFGDVGAGASRTFHTWWYDPFRGGAPIGLTTADGITLGTTVRDLRLSLDGRVEIIDDEFFGAGFVVDGLSDDRIYGTLTGVADGDVVRSLLGGLGCGE